MSISRSCWLLGTSSLDFYEGSFVHRAPPRTDVAIGAASSVVLHKGYGFMEYVHFICLHRITLFHFSPATLKVINVIYKICNMQHIKTSFYNLTLESKVDALILVSSMPPTSAGLIFSKSFVNSGNSTCLRQMEKWMS